MHVKFKTLGKKSAITVLAAIRPALKYLDKGQLVSKCLFVFSILPKNEQKISASVG